MQTIQTIILRDNFLFLGNVEVTTNLRIVFTLLILPLKKTIKI